MLWKLSYRAQNKERQWRKGVFRLPASVTQIPDPLLGQVERKRDRTSETHEL